MEPLIPDKLGANALIVLKPYDCTRHKLGVRDVDHLANQPCLEWIVAASKRRP